MTTDVHIPEYRVVILGAGPGLRADLPAAMTPIGNHGRLLDWLREAFSHLPGLRIDFVSGFMAREIMSQYDDMSFHYNADWKTTGSLRSLALAPLSSRRGTFVCYSDVVFRAESVQRMQCEAGSELVVAIDRRWKVRYDGRSLSEMEKAEKVRLRGEALVECSQRIPMSDADGEFAGLIKLSPSTATRLENVLGSQLFSDRDGLPEVLNFLVQHDTKSTVVDVDGQWAELNAPQDLARFVLGTKAESLERLRPLLKSGRIGELLRFDHRRWSDEPEVVLSAIREAFDEAVIVRSSSLGEDGWRESSAGAFKSILSLDPHDREKLRLAIDEVFASYREELDENQILVQRMIEDVRMSGVVMTRTHGHGAPYFVVSYDDTTSRTDLVTSGAAGEIKTLFLHRDRPLRADASPELARVLDAVREVEHLVGHDSLDIEFAMTVDGEVHVLQVRPIAATRDNASVNDTAIRSGLRNATAFFGQFQVPAPPVLGDRTILSVMSDWNPAEIVGTKPARLALSLYRYVITDDTWARQRAEYGYRDVRPCPLLVDILGHPYVDVRACFNSFIPAALDDDLARRLIEHHIDHLAANPELHDKVEFDVLFTCWTFDIEERVQRLAEAGFTRDERRALTGSLLELTRSGILRCRSDYDALAAADARYRQIASANVPPLRRAYLHLENATRYGALHFSHLARGAFVATSLLRSLVESGELELGERESFLASVRTVSTAIQLDASRVTRGELTWEAFVERYGHLRPGTYDVTSSRYDAAPDEFLRPMIERAASAGEPPPPYEWRSETSARFRAALERADLRVPLPAFDEFLRLAIEGREYGKFVFTRDLSAAIECLAEFGAAHFVSREELSHIHVDDLLRFLVVGTDSPSVALHELARTGQEAYRRHQSVCFPDQILSPDDLSCYELRKVSPNYVTRKRVRAAIACVDQSTRPDFDMTGKIVLIPNADPGFDWIFSREIAGLITMYGGANSHMAVRMAEFQLPGVTGVGELLFEQLRRAKTIELDCAARQIRIAHG